MKKNKIVFLLILLLFFGCKRGEISEDELILKAKKEGGKIYTYGMAHSWGPYGEIFKRFEEKYGIKHYDIDMSSAAVVETLLSEKRSPSVDTAVVGISYAEKIKKEKILSCYHFPEIEKLPNWAYDNEECHSWYATYYGTLCFMVNRDVIKNIPKSWKDLLKEEYKNKIGYLDPRHSATGFATFIAANFSQGGDLKNLEPGISFFKKLHTLGNIRKVQKRQDFLEFIKGTMPILINYDYNLLNQKYKNNLNAEIIIPSDGTVRYPYVNLIIKNSPHPYTAKLFLNFLLSEEGQRIISRKFTLPVRKDIKLEKEIEEKLPLYEEEKIFEIDWGKTEEIQEKIKKIWDELLKNEI
jgi:putative spermidine/putrescine transport system substrate-binding protein